ncbi:hypothetical protein LXL04_026622 [Taraxacum kok-saghyz]
MPQFSGSDPDGWILQSERYFAIYQLIEEEKVEAAILSLSGEALSWFHWSSKQHNLTTWGAIKTLFLKKIRPIRGGDLYEQWAAVEQTGTTMDYIRRFVELAAPLEGVSGWVALANFLKGLKPVIQNELRIWAPTGLGRAMDLAQQIEEKNWVLKSSGFGNLGLRNQTYSKIGTHTASADNNGTNFDPNRSTNAFRRNQGEDRALTEPRIQKKRAKGLCYKCDEKWNRNHRCKTQINVILIKEGEAQNDEGTDSDEQEKSTLTAAEVGPCWSRKP